MATIPPPRRSGAKQHASSRTSVHPAIFFGHQPDAQVLSTQRRSYAQCFEHFVAIAREIPADQIVACTGDARLALSNVRVCVDSVCADLTLVADHLPRMNVAELAETADIARAVVHANRLTRRRAASSNDVQSRVRKIAAPRQQLLAAARTLASRKLLPSDIVGSIGTRKGLPAMADDSVALAELFTTHADAIRGMHPFSAAEIATLREDGEWLLEALKPSGAPAKRSAKAPQTDRDALWTLLVRRHRALRRVGMYFHGDAVDEHVPPLLSRTVTRLAPDEEIDPPDTDP